MEHIGFPTETVVIFVVVVFASLFLDLYAHKKDEDITLKSACAWTIFWILLSVAFGLYLYFHHSAEMASLFFTGYVLEKVLSVDNLESDPVPLFEKLQHRLCSLSDLASNPPPFCSEDYRIRIEIFVRLRFALHR